LPTDAVAQPWLGPKSEMKKQQQLRCQEKNAEKSHNSFVFREEDNRDSRLNPESVVTLSHGGGFQPAGSVIPA
jgi:hypothetical protein